jgi:hypothetical protein
MLRLVFACDSEIVLVSCLAERLRDLVLLLGGFVVRLLGLWYHLSAIPGRVNTYREEAGHRPGFKEAHTFSALLSVFSADLSALTTCATCFASAAASFATDFSIFFASLDLKTCGALDGFMLAASSMGRYGTPIIPIVRFMLLSCQ